VGSFLRLAVVFLALATILSPASPALAANCQFVLGFKALHDLIPNVVGGCMTDEVHSAVTGDALQQTTGVNGAGGLLVWRKADNWTAYTDGFHTWINGPSGLQERLNTDRFPWEADYAMVFTLGLADLPAGYVVDDANTGPLTNAILVATADQPGQEQAFLQRVGRTGGYQIEFDFTGSTAAPQAQLILSGANTYAALRGAQAEWTLADSIVPTGWQQMSAPTVGDQSIAFSRPNTLTANGQDVPATDYLVRFRVGTVVAFVQTATPAAGASPGQTIAFAQAMVSHVRARGGG
jgi:hypothetical protein